LGITTVLDYSNSQIISLEPGLAAKQDGTFKIIHIFNLLSYEEILANLEESFHSLTSSHPLHPYLSYELKQIHTDLLVSNSKKTKEGN